DGKDGHGYSASSMRTAVAAFTAFYNLHLGRDWKLFRLMRSPSPQTLPTVLTRDEVKRLFRVIREQRFRVILRLIYMCGLRVSEAIALEVTDIKREGPHLHLKKTKFSKERLVPLPLWVYRELQDYWKTHRHPRWVFPGVGRGWRETPGGIQRLHQAVEPMGAVRFNTVCDSLAPTRSCQSRRTCIRCDIPTRRICSRKASAYD
ncbi:MAG TPA: tyrosine-type recombinase/integrase, partial [Opitutus sp.]|nr:tyrosine-type recombinase/integrase [Opitutus sp.]